MKKICSNYKVLFCYCLILIAIFMVFLIIVIKPKKNSRTFLYNTGLMPEKVVFQDKIEQYIHLNADIITSLYVDVGTKAFENVNFNIKVIGENGEIYYDTDVSNYDSTIFYISLGYLTNMKNKTLKLIFECKEKSLLTVKTSRSFNSKTHISNYNNKTLNISLDTMSQNKGYYWYPVMIMSIAFLLLPYAKGDKNEE